MVGEKIIFHICRTNEWQAAIVAGSYEGSSQDVADGFIHFSTADQLSKSASIHRRGQQGLVLLSVDSGLLGESLKWEKSRGGNLFPHLYGQLPLTAVIRVDELAIGSEGLHVFPEELGI